MNFWRLFFIILNLVAACRSIFQYVAPSLLTNMMAKSSYNKNKAVNKIIAARFRQTTLVVGK